MVWRTTWLGTERREGSTKQAARPVGEVNAGRSQSPNSTANGEVSRTVETCVRAKGALGKWGRKVDSQGPERAEMKVEASRVSATTRRDASALGSSMQRKFAPAPIWTEAMLAALQSGVRGGKWLSLIDKVSRLETLELGWTQVERNAGAAGVDRMSVERFAQARAC